MVVVVNTCLPLFFFLFQLSLNKILHKYLRNKTDRIALNEQRLEIGSETKGSIYKFFAKMLRMRHL